MTKTEEKQNELINRQMDTISKLQETINLQKFDVVQLQKDNRRLENEKNIRTKIIISVREKLSQLRKKENISEKDLLKIMKGMSINEQKD